MNKVNETKWGGMKLTIKQISEEINKDRNFSGAVIDFDQRDVDVKLVDLSKSNFKYATLKKLKAKRANFSDSNFEGAELDGCNFELAELLRTNMSNTKIKNSIFEKANMEGVNLQNSIVGIPVSSNFKSTGHKSNVDFTGCILDHANMENSQFGLVSFNNSHMHDVQASGSIFYLSNLSGVNLNRCNFTASIFDSVKLNNMELFDVNFDNAVFKNMFSKNPYIEITFKDRVKIINF